MAGDQVQSEAGIGIVKYFGWSNVALLGSDDDYGRGYIDAFRVSGGSQGIQAVTTSLFSIGATTAETEVNVRSVCQSLYDVMKDQHS